ncbi:hypothetical protein C8R43DRAFT_1004327 [Mycena crocata]|nr:hypothetical protein C8R43DRAFT_1004327 [Mycena crocata]
MLPLLALPAVKSSDPVSTRAASDDSCNDIHSCRLLFDIVWGCLATVFACVWVAVHPNVPAPTPPALPKGASLWRRLKWRLVDTHGALRARLKLLLVGLLAPEFIAGFAARQLAIAWKFSNKYDLSLTHGFFICMGGFVDSHGHPIVTSVQLEQPGVLLAIRNTPESSIEDKSKGDAFAKGVAFVQGLWFIVHCIARGRQHLPLTLLEFTTLAYAAVSLFMWLLWWGKPLDVRDTITVPVATSELAPEGENPSQGKRGWNLKLRTLLGATYDKDAYNPLADSAVPTFWHVAKEELMEDDDRRYYVAAAFCQMMLFVLFGLLHCLAWHAAFASPAEKWLWRISAIGITAGITFWQCVERIESAYTGRDPLPPESYGKATILFTLMLYITPRLILLILPFTALRALPAGIFVDVDWSMYIPHW